MIDAKNTQALDEAIAIAGGAAALADLLNRNPSLVGMWKKRGNVPAEYCPDIERFTGVACERLRPDVNWSVLRQSKRRTKAVA